MTRFWTTTGPLSPWPIGRRQTTRGPVAPHVSLKRWSAVNPVAAGTEDLGPVRRDRLRAKGERDRHGVKRRVDSSRTVIHNGHGHYNSVVCY